MSIKINNPKTADLDTIWMNYQVRSDQSDPTNNSGSSHTITIDKTSEERSGEDIEKAMQDVISKNKELYKRLAE